ncbi:zinc finger domain-containing protein 14 [Dermatophagoides farinae]|uniref:Zinc finger domain-containing protein 14 n=1 Tax=Dermatophagoides farinae TaxID=6954 RepID=A0A9D4NTQ9_DERFA|nr:zinc finger domain-containing protein 14 [Dermatophagoides farinae]
MAASDSNDDDDEECSGYSSDSSKSSTRSSSNQFRYSNEVIIMANRNHSKRFVGSSSSSSSTAATPSKDNDNLFTSLCKSPNSLPRISFMSGLTENNKSSLQGLPNRLHATVPAPDARPIPSRSTFDNQQNQKQQQSGFSQKLSLVAENDIAKKPKFRTRVKKEDIVDIPITERDREILLAIGKIKRQKQRPSVDRLYNLLARSKHSDWDTKNKIQCHLDDMILRSLLARVNNADKGFVSYRELNSAIPIVAINNPLKSRVHLLNDISKSSDNNNQTAKTCQSTSPTFPKNSSTKTKSVSTSTTTTTTTLNSIDESIERVVRRYCKDSLNRQQSITTTSIDNDSENNNHRSYLHRKCGMCGHSTKDDENDELITCSVCGMSGHSSCLGCSPSLLARIRQLPNWECPNCKKCPRCGQHDDETNIVCVVCDRAFHRTCLRWNPSNSVSK